MLGSALFPLLLNTFQARSTPLKPPSKHRRRHEQFQKNTGVRPDLSTERPDGQDIAFENDHTKQCLIFLLYVSKRYILALTFGSSLSFWVFFKNKTASERACSFVILCSSFCEAWGHEFRRGTSYRSSLRSIAIYPVFVLSCILFIHRK